MYLVTLCLIVKLSGYLKRLTLKKKIFFLLYVEPLECGVCFALKMQCKIGYCQRATAAKFYYPWTVCNAWRAPACEKQKNTRVKGVFFCTLSCRTLKKEGNFYRVVGVVGGRWRGSSGLVCLCWSEGG